jgi:lipid II:glycine glycyltransferase (peptidoglycan interpeptide bridge formation enzyme)
VRNDSERSFSLQPQHTSIIDLARDEDILLRRMHHKTRYNIRLAERKGVSVRRARDSEADMDKFYAMLCGTAERDGFRPHARMYYRALLGARSEDFSNELFFAEYSGVAIAACLVNFYHSSSTATYLHGASDNEHRNVMAPYLLHWWIMQDAKQRGYQYYDLWGIDPHKWPGLTRFKRGFGGRDVAYHDSFDVVYRPGWYRVYKLARRIR